MSFDRREFLTRAGGGLVALSIPGWRVFAQGTGSIGADRQERDRAAAAAFERARLKGRPLLVINVPEDPAGRSYRGGLFGTHLNRAAGEAAAELAMCEIWCATATEIRRAWKIEAPIGDGIQAVLIETDGSAPAFITGEVPPDPEFDYWSEAARDPSKWIEAEQAKQRWLAQRIHEVLVPDLTTLLRRVQAERDALAARPDPSIGSRLSDRESPTARHAEIVPAWTYWRTQTAEPKDRLLWIELLASEAVRRWRVLPPPRSRWATTKVCAIDVEYLEGDPELEDDRIAGFACGIGHTPEYSSRFLLFFLDRDT